MYNEIILRCMREILLELDKYKNMSVEERKNILYNISKSKIFKCLVEQKCGYFFPYLSAYLLIKAIINGEDQTKGFEKLSEFYNKFLQIYKSMFEKLEITDPLDISNLFYQMVSQGVFCLDDEKQTYYGSIFDHLIERNVPFIETFASAFNPLWYSRMLNDFLENFGFKSQLLSCDLDRTDPIYNGFILPVGKSCISYPRGKNGIKIPIANFIYNGGTQFVYDMERGLAFNIANGEQQGILLSDIKLYNSCLLNDYASKNPQDVSYLDLLLNCEGRIITSEEGYKSFLKCSQLLYDNKDIVKATRLEAKPYIEKMLEMAKGKQKIIGNATKK